MNLETIMKKKMQNTYQKSANDLVCFHNVSKIFFHSTTPVISQICKKKKNLSRFKSIKKHFWNKYLIHLTN